jgi:hypothetical protein
MKSSRIFAAASVTVLLAMAAPATAAVTSAPAARTTVTTTHAGTTAAASNTHNQPADLSECSAAFFDGDPRLGPARLPVLGVVGIELTGYRRTGGLSPAAFLAQYYSPTANGGSGGWIYPPDNGYVIGKNGQPVEWKEQLRPGRQIDRYGSEYGSFLAPAGSLYSERSIPPQSLDSTPPATCNYHDYRVLKDFAVDAGPVAPWFAQPGLGLQYQLDASLIPGAPATVNVMWLINNGYLDRVA